MNLAAALSGRAGLEGVRWLLTGAPHRALRRELGALLSSPDRLGSCRLRSARLKPGRWFAAFYDVDMRGEGGDKRRTRPIAVSWKLNGLGDRRRAVECGETEAEAVRRGVAAPFRKLVADVPRWGMHVEVSPFDVRYPQLVRLSDRQYARDTIAAAYAARDGAGEYARATDYSTTAIRYRPGKRHVLRYDSADPSTRRVLFAKLYTGDDGLRVSRLATQIGEWLAERGVGTPSVRPPAYVAEDKVVFWPQAAGSPISELLRDSGQILADCVKRAGAALYALHQLPPAAAVSLEVHDFAAEVTGIAKASDHVAALLPPAGVAIASLLERAQEFHQRLPSEPATFTFGEFKAEHVWVTPDGLTLIDFDGCCLGDPALDIGKFLADLRLWDDVSGHGELKQVQEQFLAGYRGGALADRLARARLYEAIELVKKTVRHVRTFEHGWARRAERLIGCAQSVLGDVQAMVGLGQDRREALV